MTTATAPPIRSTGMFFPGAISPERNVAQEVPLRVRMARIPVKNAIPTMQQATSSCRRIKEVREAPYTFRVLISLIRNGIAAIAKLT